MAWKSEMVLMLRGLISDFDKTSYTDDRLQQLLVIAAHYVRQEVDFTQTYTISVTAKTISPDPCSSTNADKQAFTNFTVLKAACLTDWSTYRSKALSSGIRARCGPAQLETLQHLKGFRDLIDFGPCKAYETLKEEHEFGNYTLKAILSPFTSSNFDAGSLHSPRNSSSDESRGGFF
jgi:hypothetical protein